MGGAISISANNDTNERIYELWGQVARFEATPSMAGLNYPPHFLFAIYQNADQQKLEAVTQSVFKNVDPVRITFGSIQSFEASPLVVWAAPNDPSILLRLHSAIHNQIDPTHCHEHYRPESWIPHCTLGAQISEANRADALSFAGDGIDLFDVIFDRADCISFPPVEVTKSFDLCG